MSLLLRQWERHFGTVQNELFFNAGYSNGHLERIDNRIKSRRSKKRVPKQPRHFLSNVGTFFGNTEPTSRAVRKFGREFDRNHSLHTVRKGLSSPETLRRIGETSMCIERRFSRDRKTLYDQ
jgi:hypothetical protein